MIEMVAPMAVTASLRHHPLVVTALGALPAPHDPLWPVVAAGIGDAVSAALADPMELMAAAAKLADTARSHGCDAIKGASPIGDNLAGAVASSYSIRLFDPAVPASRVLLVDGVLATGAALWLAVDDLQSTGPTPATLAVLVDLGATASCAAGLPVVEI
jgi:hypothetical protein